MANGFIEPQPKDEDADWPSEDTAHSHRHHSHSPRDDAAELEEAQEVRLEEGSMPRASASAVMSLPPQHGSPSPSSSPSLSSLPSAHSLFSSPTTLSPVASQAQQQQQQQQQQQRASISVEQLQELAIQDSANNNVDENSNDQQYDRYANYPHHEVDSQQFTGDQSVRPRIRPRPDPRDEPDRSPFHHQAPLPSRRGSGLSHRRNLSEGLPSPPSASNMYPMLPNLNFPSDGPMRRLPRHESDQGPYQLQGCSGSPYPPRGWLPLTLQGGGYGPQPPPLPPAEDVAQEAQELLTVFTSETLRNNQLEVPESVLGRPSFSNPHMVRAGRELRMLADAFAKTDERRKVQLMAETVNMSSINMENFFQLCTELFYDGITRERIVALFTFVGDIAVHQVRMKGEVFIQLLMKWSLKYLVDHICRWVQEAGGWVAVLSCGAGILYRCAVFAFCVCGTIAAGLFILKTVKHW